MKAPKRTRQDLKRYSKSHNQISRQYWQHELTPELEGACLHLSVTNNSFGRAVASRKRNRTLLNF